ncbi:hypothetical protein [Melittangium boletus]|uniref:Uncharacterized protein n=1 Tax=Melittangium boletus DSM 14713 TaxID=1294270 RepID=A0A250IJS3_9BACT|nr:hypothetical protein [Melittangium boletus]ATB31452.1 hypothetical protein MEBOL_004915 [Melittangium boletus DSM 14713]
MTRPPPSTPLLTPRDERDSRDIQAAQVQRISEGMRKGTISAQDGLNLLREQQRISAVRQEAEVLRKTPGDGEPEGQESTRRGEKLREVSQMQERSARSIAQAEEKERGPAEPHCPAA